MQKETIVKELTVKELMECLGLSRATMWTYRNNGMPFERKLNGQVRFNADECKKWIKEKFNR